MTPTLATLIEYLDGLFPPSWAEEWDRVGLVLGEPDTPAARVLLTVDCLPETVTEARERNASLIIAHHPLLLRGVSSVAPTTATGRIVHDLIRSDIALFTIHTNADIAAPGVSDALAHRLGLTDLRPLRPATGLAAGEGRGTGRVGQLPEPMPLADFTGYVAERLPGTVWGVRGAGDPQRAIRSVAVCGGAGDSYLPDAASAGVNAYVTADLRHHPASAHITDGGPCLIDAAHWATERPWLDELAGVLRAAFPIDVMTSGVSTDPWSTHAAAPQTQRTQQRLHSTLDTTSQQPCRGTTAAT